MDERKEAALAALHTWRAYMDDRDRLIIAARKAGATIAEIMTASGLAKGTVRAALPATPDQEDTAMTTTSTLARYHHPNYLGHKAPQHQGGPWSFTFHPFTGHESDPEEVEGANYWKDDSLSREEYELLGAEYRAARITWSRARFKLQARPLLMAAAPVWQEYASARKQAEACFAAFWDTPNEQWKAQQLRLADAHRALRVAASRWDETANPLAHLEEKHLHEAGELNELTLRDVAPEFGLDASSWDIEWYGDYDRGRRPAVETAEKMAQEHRRRLAEVI